jgi:hypothetical protein
MQAGLISAKRSSTVGQALFLQKVVLHPVIKNRHNASQVYIEPVWSNSVSAGRQFSLLSTIYRTG